jgi:hypothetical protein
MIKAITIRIGCYPPFPVCAVPARRQLRAAVQIQATSAELSAQLANFRLLVPAFAGRATFLQTGRECPESLVLRG